MGTFGAALMHLALFVAAGTAAEGHCHADEGNCSEYVVISLGQNQLYSQFCFNETNCESGPDATGGGQFDVDAIVAELRTGESGFVVVPAVFPPEEVAEARQRILALIEHQGEKATHFQVELRT